MVMPIDQGFNDIVARQSVPDEPIYSRKQRAVDIPYLKMLEDAVKKAPEGTQKIAIEELRKAKEKMAAALAEERVMSFDQAMVVIESLLANYGG